MPEPIRDPGVLSCPPSCPLCEPVSSTAAIPDRPAPPGRCRQLHLHLLLQRVAHGAHREVCGDGVREVPLPGPHRLLRGADQCHYLLYPLTTPTLTTKLIHVFTFCDCYYRFTF